MKKNIFKAVVNTALVAIDLMVFLLAIDAGYGWLGLICSIYIAVRFLSPDATGLIKLVNTLYDQVAEWLEQRKEAKEVEPVAEVIEAVEAEEI